MEWCACFVSRCAEECGYIEAGIIPKFSLCSDGVNWFKAQGQWQDRNYEPMAEISSFLIEAQMGLLTMWVLWNTAKMALSIPWKETPGTLADRRNIRWEAAISTDMGSRHIEKGERSQKALFTIHSVNQKIQVFLWRGSNLIDPVTIRFLLSMKPGDHKVCERILKFEKCYGRLLAQTNQGKRGAAWLLHTISYGKY